MTVTCQGIIHAIGYKHYFLVYIAYKIQFTQHVIIFNRTVSTLITLLLDKLHFFKFRG